MTYNKWVNLVNQLPGHVDNRKPSPDYWYQEYFIGSVVTREKAEFSPCKYLSYPERYSESVLDGMDCYNMFEWKAGQ